MKQIIPIILVLTMVISLLCACTNDPTMPTTTTPTTAPTTMPAPSTAHPVSNDPSLEILSFYLEYCEATKRDSVMALLQYVHYEDKETLKLALSVAPDDPVMHYEIIRLERLSDDLWLIEECFYSKLTPGGICGLNFVGRINGKLYVITGKSQIPPHLKEGLVIEDYTPHGPGILVPDDVLGPIE